jgi:hypothetical protein
MNEILTLFNQNTKKDKKRKPTKSYYENMVVKL